METVVVIIGFDATNPLQADVTQWTPANNPGILQTIFCSPKCTKTEAVITGMSIDPARAGTMVSVFTQDPRFKPAETYIVPFSSSTAGGVTVTALDNARAFVNGLPAAKIAGKIVLIVDPSLAATSP